MVEAKIRSTPDEDLQYRSQEVKANNKTIVTPTKTIDPAKIHPEVSISKDINCINELYARLSKKRYTITSSDLIIVSNVNKLF